MRTPTRFAPGLATFLLAACLAATASLGADNDPLDKRIIAALQPFVDSHALAGAVTLVTDRNSFLEVQAVGFADLAAKRPMTPDTLFWIASQTKSITATALMMLVDEGKLKLDDPVEKYLPEFGAQWVAVESDDAHMVPEKPHHPMTVRNLLSHTSGLPSKSVAEGASPDLLPLRVSAMTYAMTPLLSEPGTKYLYSNAGINTVGRLIEVISGIPYADFLNQRLFEPLGMKDTTFWPNDEQISRLAKVYTPTADKTDLRETKLGIFKQPLSDRIRQPLPAGGLFSTAADVARFCRMILEDGVYDGKRYISAAAIAEMTRKQTPEPLKELYGLGWAGTNTSFGHGGAAGTNMYIDKKRGWIRIYLVQLVGLPAEGDKGQKAFNKAVDAYLHEKPAAKPKP